MLKSWRVWLVLLTCSLFFASAVISYVIEWGAGWFFAATTIFAGLTTWIGESDFRAFHQFQLITLERKLNEAQAAQRDRQDELDFSNARIKDVTDQFLDEHNHQCKECKVISPWFYTVYKFHPNAHREKCGVAYLRALLEPPALWLPTEFSPDYLEAGVDEVALASDSRLVGFFPYEGANGGSNERDRP